MKPIKFRHGRRVITFNHETRHNVEIYRFEEPGQRVQLEKRDGAVWRAGLWTWTPDTATMPGAWDFAGWLRAGRGRKQGMPCERFDPRSLAKAAVIRWSSTHE